MQVKQKLRPKKLRLFNILQPHSLLGHYVVSFLPLLLIETVVFLLFFHLEYQFHSPFPLPWHPLGRCYDPFIVFSIEYDTISSHYLKHFFLVVPLTFKLALLFLWTALLLPILHSIFQITFYSSSHFIQAPWQISLHKYMFLYTEYC
jgi:hypothetical protein